MHVIDHKLLFVWGQSPKYVKVRMFGGLHSAEYLNFSADSQGQLHSSTFQKRHAMHIIIVYAKAL
jgi:hypothetical protein